MDGPVIDKLNKIRNADFSRGAKRPLAWTYTGSRKTQWQYIPGDQNGDIAGMAVRADAPASAGWSQTFRCRKDQYYRVEAVVTCRCQPDAGKTQTNGSGATGGLVVAVQMLDENKKPLRRLELPPITSAERLIHRTYFETCENTRSVRVTVGLENARGDAVIHEVRVLAVIEPELKSYPLAVPPPPFGQPSPVRTKRVGIVTTDAQRRIVTLLGKYFGEKNVDVCAPKAFNARRMDHDALMFPDQSPPRGCGRLKQLLDLAKKRIVIVSTQCFENIAGDAVKTRLIKQIDDPIHARVVHSNYATRGFALHDIIPFSRRAGLSTEMSQRQFRGGPAFRQFCSKHELEPLLFSMTDADTTSEKPIALFRQFDKGALIVMDIDAVEVADTSTDDATVALHLVLGALGVSRGGVGQYTDPARNIDELREHLCDLVDRFDGLYWHDRRAPRDLDSPLIIRLGREMESAGLLMRPRPVILIRSGLSGHDIEGAYAVMLWLKQLLRPAPYASPYAHLISARHRVLWSPLSQKPDPWGGWRSDEKCQPFVIEPEFEPGSVACCIDVTTTATHAIRVIGDTRDATFDRLENALPQIAGALTNKTTLYHTVPQDSPAANFASALWRMDDLQPQVITAAGKFSDSIHRAVRKAGGRLLRLELPTSGCLSAANSIWRTDWAVNVIEQLIGLEIGCIVPNRGDQPLRLTWPEALSDLRDAARMMQFNNRDESPVRFAADSRVTIAPGNVLVALR